MVDLVVIGAMKAGTSTLYETLLQHPGICLTKYKEANFFNRPIDERRMIWYRKQFDCTANTQLKSDISPNYAKSHLTPSTAKQLSEYAPSTKIIYILRDPIKRIISHLHHDALRDRLRNRNLLEALSNPDYIMTSRYFYQLTCFKKYYDEQQILVLNFEDLINTPNVVLQRIQKFLRIEIYNLTLNPGFLTEKRYWIPYYDFVHRIIKSHRVIKLYHILWYMFNIKRTKPILGDAVISHLKTNLSDDFHELVNHYPGINYNWDLSNRLLLL